jgi:inner membrane protein
MHREGHVGFSLIILSVVMWLLNSWNYEALTTAIIALGFSTFPDVDLKLGIAHRKWTHSIFFGLIAGLSFGWIAKMSGLSFEVGFLGAFGGILLHILGDLLTYRAFAPLYPLSKRKIAFGLFRSDNAIVNRLMLILGVLAFSILYLHCNSEYF